MASTKNIQYVGFVNEMQEMYQACDYSVLASFYDPLETVGMECMEWDAFTDCRNNRQL